jgi:hypothetical protein
MSMFGKVAIFGAGVGLGALGMFIYGVKTVGLENAELKERLEESEKQVKKLDSIIRELVDDLQEQGFDILETEDISKDNADENVKDKASNEYPPEWPEDRREKMGDKKKHYEKMHESKENHKESSSSADREHPVDSDEDDSDDSEDDLDDMDGVEMTVNPPIDIDEEVYFIKEEQLRDVPDEYSVLYLTYKGYIDTIYEDESGEEYDYMQREYALGNLMEKEGFPEWIEDMDTVWIRNDKFHTLYEIECYLNDSKDGDEY